MAHREAAERGDGVRLRPKSGLSRPKPAVTIVDQQLIIEPALDVVTFSGDADFMPLPERRSLCADSGDQVTTADDRGNERIRLVIIEVEIVLQRVGPDNVIVAFGKAKHDPAGSVLTPGDGLEAYLDSDIGIGSARRDDNIERFVRGTLDQRLATLRSPRHVFNHPCAAYSFPAIEWLYEVVSHLRSCSFTGRPKHRYAERGHSRE